MPSNFSILSIIGSAGALAGAAWLAAAPRPAAAEEPRRGPPPEAIAACEDLDEGDACTVSFRERTLEGTCATTPDGELACRPARGSGPPRPPAEAITACDGLDEGAACSVTLGELTLEGTCAATPDDELACRPAGPPPQGHRPPREASAH